MSNELTLIEALEKRVVELEAEIARLKAAPPQQHLHYYYSNQPYYIPQPWVYPVQPSIGPTWGAGLAGFGGQAQNGVGV